MIKDKLTVQSVVFSLSLHLLVIGVMVFAAYYQPSKKVSVSRPETEVIQAVAINEKDVLVEVERLKKQRSDELALAKKREQEREAKLARLQKQRQQEEARLKRLEAEKIAEQKRIQQEKAAKEAELAALEAKKKAEQEQLSQLKKQQQEAKKRHEQEAAKLAELEKKRKAKELAEKKAQEALAKLEAAKKAEQEKQRKAQAEKERQARLAQQKAATQAEVQKFVWIIKQKIESSWLKPAASSQGLSCTLAVKLLPTGDVALAQVKQSSGDPLFDDSAIRAVYKASPLPVPENPHAFNEFRELILPFNPDA